jgi:putative ABC transport system substrate-binding protein
MQQIDEASAENWYLRDMSYARTRQQVRRRDFIALVGGATVWPLAARAQQSAMPVIGFMVAGVQGRSQQIAAFHAGLKESGYVQGQNVTVELRSVEGHFDRYPALAADLLRHGLAVLVAINNDAALAAKLATVTTPIVFGMGGDPVALGLVASLSHPGGNITGIYFFTQGLEGKRLGLLHELVPRATTLAVLVNPDYSPAKNQLQEVQEAAARLGVQVLVLRANVETDFDAVFADLARQRAGALLVCASPFFFTRRQQLVALAARHAVAAIYEWREFATAGGLMSYGTNITDAYRQMGVYAGRILKGEKPADLPVVQSTKFEFVINLGTAKALHIEVPPMLYGRADEVIE